MEQLGLSVARMVDLPFRLLRPQFFQLWLPTTAMAVVAGGPVQLSAASMQTFDATNPDLTKLFASLGGLAVSLPLMFVGYVLITGLAFGAVLDVTEGRSVDFVRSARALDVSRLAVIAASFLAVGLGASCCVLPGIAVSTYLGLATPVAFLEREGVGGAFQRSLDLVRGGRDGAWWNDVVARSLAMVVVAFLLRYALTGIVTLPQTAWAFKVGFESATSGNPSPGLATAIPLWLRIATMVGAGGVVALTILYTSAAAVLLYRYARERLEGTGLEAAIQDYTTS
jgi:hypothetical protein